MLRRENMILIGRREGEEGEGREGQVAWLPTYLIEALGFDRGAAKWFSALPWILSAPAFAFGGWLTDRLAARTGNLKLARCGVGAAGYAASALALLVVPQLRDRTMAAVFIALALCFQTTTISAAWAVCLDVGRRYAGVVTGFMNTVGNLGGAIGPLVIGRAVGHWHSWTLPFYLMAAVFGFGIVMWLLVDPSRSVLDDHDLESHGGKAKNNTKGQRVQKVKGDQRLDLS